ncbi:kinase-like domain-containing protein [Phaeosphaeriaceae sp. PMI808]|nr:kinase-like domain-containing protein [Phaeosphaeriaceae sp. PMI808]
MSQPIKDQASSADPDEINSRTQLLDYFYDSFTEGEKEPVTSFEYWCITNGLDSHSPDTLKAYVAERDLQTRVTDPIKYPGLQNLVELRFGDDASIEDISMERLKPLLEALNAKHASMHISTRFGIGSTIDGRWNIVSRIDGPLEVIPRLPITAKSINGAVFIVEDKYEQCTKKTPYIMRLLPENKLNPNHARREIEGHSELKHKNIVRVLHATITDCAHATPWMVTEFCDKGTLQGFIRYYIMKQELVSELFVWQVFESLASAVQYTRQRPADLEECGIWNEIAHLNIQMSNVFLKTRPHNWHHAEEYRVTVKLGNWGSSILRPEWEERNLSVRDLPFAPSLGPHENYTEFPSEAEDVYQIGLVIRGFFSLTESTPPVNHRDLNSEKLFWKGRLQYSTELRDIMNDCLNWNKEDRPNSSFLVDVLGQKRKALLRDGKLTRRELDFPAERQELP